MASLKGQGINIITVPICSRCGRGFIGQFAKNAMTDTQPIWWWSEEKGPFCNGQIIHYDRLKQIEKLAYAAEGILSESPVAIIGGGEI